jgi:uncharacterized lipoprotein YddW (UPF0748 family)
MPVRVTPEQYADKHNRRLKAAIEDVRTGVQRVTESPTIKAAAHQDKMLAELTRAVQSGKWAQRLKAVTLEDWRAKMIDKGVPRIASGIDAARPKVVAFATELINYENTVLAEIDRMPELTIEDSIARATQWIRRMAAFTRR